MYNMLFNFITPAAQDEPLTEYTIGGVQSGTLPLGDYTVESDIVVLTGTTLTLTAGSIFRMKENVLWQIEGALIANGDASNRITFQTADDADHWHGIRICVEEVQTTATATFNDSTNVVSTSFGLNEDWPIKFTTTGTLPAELNPNQRYYLLSGNKLSLRMGGAEIDLTDTGTGTHTAHRLYPNGTGLDGDETAENSITYCDFYDCDKSNLPSNYSLSYRHWQRGGALFLYELEDITIDHCTFTDCATVDRGAGIYAEGTTVDTWNFSYLTFVNCVTDDEFGAAYAQSHSSPGFSLDNCTFTNSTATAVQGVPFTVNDSTNVITITNPSGIPIRNGMQIKDLASSGTLPGGLSGSTVYYMKNVSGTTQFEVSLTPGGSSVNITDTGSGSHTCTALEDMYWFDTDATLTNITIN